MKATFNNIRSACPLCGGTPLKHEFSLHAFDTDFSWDRCDACSLVFQNPKLTAAGSRALYKQSAYFGGSAQSAYEDFTRDDPLRIAQSKRRLDLIKSRTGIDGGALLDIGSASGFFGYSAKQRGFDVTCVEPDEAMCAFGRSTYGLNMHADTIESFDGGGRLHDLVTLWGTDSHFDDPLEGFAKIHSLLKPGGVLAMNFQDFHHPIRKIFPGIKQGWNAGYMLSDKSIRLLMTRTGFEISSIGTEWHTATIGHVARAAKLTVPTLVKNLPVTLPAISFKMLLARSLPAINYSLP